MFGFSNRRACIKATLLRPGRILIALEPAETTRVSGAVNWKVGKNPFPMQVLSDPQTGEAPGETRGRNVRSKNQCSMCPAIHTKSRSWLRSSSTREPSDPLLRVVFYFMYDQPFQEGRSSPTKTLLRLLLPLNDQVWSSFRHFGSTTKANPRASPKTSLNHSIGSSDGRCGQRAGT
ncbi:uncharacterized protein CEXT_367671 [Caerostris extrusa]|uniref:Uncharacterized protein n=1 Tax=Caerostris extrusa TaxID=172846 RepID=A0AAV4TAG3_CAEEX|nr:uncharacterized protein CEXT_367671 [Caerostris extrusa]